MNSANANDRSAVRPFALHSALRRSVALLVAALTIVTAGSAYAQTTGIRVGGGMIKPQLTIGGEYQTNANRASGTDVGGNTPYSDFILRVQPGVLMAFPNRYVQFVLNGSAWFNKFFGIDNPATDQFSNIWAQVAVDLVFNPRGNVTFTLNNQFVRSDDPANNSLQLRVGLFNNRTGAMLDIKPGGGALSFQLAYAFSFTIFDSGEGLELFNNTMHFLGFQAKWRLLPRTAVFFQADAIIPGFRDDGSRLNETTGQTVQTPTPKTYPLYLRVGGATQLTTSLQLSASLGFGSSLTQGAGNDAYNSVLAKIEAVYYVTRTLSFDLGYARNFQPSAIYTFVGTDTISGGTNMVLFKRLRLGVRAAYEWENYGQIAPQLVGSFGFENASRGDRILSIGVPIEVGIIKYLSFLTRYNFDWRDSNIAVQSFKNHTIFFGFRGEY